MTEERDILPAGSTARALPRTAFLHRGVTEESRGVSASSECTPSNVCTHAFNPRLCKNTFRSQTTFPTRPEGATTTAEPSRDVKSNMSLGRCDAILVALRRITAEIETLKSEIREISKDSG